MQPADRVEFVKVLNGLAAVKPGARLTPEAIEVWWRTMRLWTLKDFSAAAEHLAAAIEFMPNPFHFEQLRRAGEVTAGEAWALVLAASKHHDHPEKLPRGRVARAAAAVGGFRAIAFCDCERDLPFVERRFKEAYDDLTDVEHAREAVPHIANADRHLLQQLDPSYVLPPAEPKRLK